MNEMFQTGDRAHKVRSWYGVAAEIAVENDLWHLVRIGPVSLPHPPLVNLLLRRGQPRQERLILSFLHEFGHLQTLPVAITHGLWLQRRIRGRERSWRQRLMVWLVAIVAHEAVWELASETYVLAHAGRKYGQIYRRCPNAPGLILFWTGMPTLAIALTRRLLENEPVFQCA
jgi:hypothetical protein